MCIARVVIMCLSTYDALFIRALLPACLVASFGLSSILLDRQMFVICQSPFPFCIFSGYRCTILPLIICLFRATLTCAVVSVALDEKLWNTLRCFGRVVNIYISVTMDYVSEAAFHGDVGEDMIYNIHIYIACGIRCW